MQGPHPSLLATPTPVQKFAAPKPAPQVVASTKPCRPVIRFEVEGDSAARAAWRSRKPHNGETSEFHVTRLGAYVE